MSGSYSITLAIVPNDGVISGTTVKTSTSGVATFSGLRILSSGTYKITATSDPILSAESELFTIENFITDLEVSVSKNVVYAYERFQLTSKLYGEDEKPFILPAQIFITEINSSLINGNVNLTTQTGTSITNLYFYESGEKTLIISADEIDVTVSITVKDLINSDIKCVKSKDSSTCIECTKGAQLFDGICECTANSNYSYTDRMCVCDEGYSPNNNFCVKCGKYYSSSEVSSKFSDDFTTIFIKFSVQPLSLLKCSTFLILPSSLTNYSFICTWENSLTLSLKFNKVPPAENLVIGLDPLIIQKQSQQCTFTVSQLNLKVEHDKTLPIPDSVITAPSIFSLACARSDLSFSVPNNGKESDYKWSGIYNPSNSNVTSYLSSLSANSGKISLDLLSLGTLTLTAEVSSSAFNTKSSSTKEIKIDSSPYLTIELTSGSSISIKQSAGVMVKAMIKENCGGSEYDYSWKYVSSTPSLDFASILAASSRPNTLLISPNSLTAGYSYEFQVTVGDGSASGTASVVVNVQSSSLNLALSRSSGSIGTDSDFYVKAIASDPDDSKIKISFEWTCSEATSACQDNAGQDLIDSSSSSSSELNIDKLKLRNNAVYVFTVTAQTDEKYRSMSIEISVQSGLKGSINIKQSLDKINIGSQLNIIPSIVNINSNNLVWSVSQGPSLNLDHEYSFLTIQSNTLTEGTFYELKLKLTNSGQDLEAYYSFTTNSPPACESISFTSETTKLTIIASGCVDGDDSDYPLIFQYGLVENKKEVWVSSTTLSSEFSLMAKSSTEKVKTKVCDSLLSCITIYTDLNSARRLDETSDDFDQDSSDYESIPSAIVYYSSLATKDTLKQMIQKFKVYVQGSLVDSNELDLIVDTLFYIFNAKAKLTQDQANYLVEILLDVMIDVDFDLTDEQVIAIYSCLDDNAHLISPSSMVSLIEIVRYRWIVNKVPFSQVIYSSSLFISYTRGLTSNYKNLKFSKGKISVLVPVGFIESAESVIDLTICKFYDNSLPLFELSIQFSGKYESSTLYLTSPENYDKGLNESIKVTYTSSEFDENSVCQNLDKYNWTATGCKVKEQSPNSLTFEISNPMLLKIEKFDYSNFINGLCIFIIYGLLFAGFVLICVSCIMDRGLTPVTTSKTLLMLYPLASVMIPQPRPWRRLYALHLVASQGLLLALIGGFYKFYPQNGGFVIETTAKSGICACLSQAHCISNLILIFATIKHKKIIIIFYLINLLVLCMSFAAVTVILSFGAEDFVFNWVCGYILFGSIDVILVEFLYAWILFSRNKGKLTHSLVNNASFDDSPNKDLGDSVAQIGRNDSSDDIFFNKSKKKRENDSTTLSMRQMQKDKIDGDKKFNTHFN